MATRDGAAVSPPPRAQASGGTGADSPAAEPASRGCTWVSVAGAAALYAAVTPWVLRPWFLAGDLLPHAPGSYGSLVDADLALNLWILAWIAHAALADPTRLFDGNIFYPATNTIAGSENMLAHLPVTAAALALSGNALVMLKAYVLESFVFSGVAMFLFVRHHTRSVPAALLGGAAFTFTYFRATTIPQPQYLGIQYLPLALLCVDLWLERRRAGSLIGLALAIWLQALSCVYVGFFILIVVPVYALVRLAAVHERRDRAAAGLVAAIGGGVLAFLPAALPYLYARAEGLIPQQDPTLIHYVSWAPWDYFSRGFVERAGIVPLSIVVVDALTRLLRRRHGDVAVREPTRSVERALWAVAGTGVVLSAGPSLDLAGLSLPMPYRFLYAVVPGFSSLRVPIRFAIVVAAALAALAGIAVARWSGRLGAPARALVVAGLTIACVLDSAPRPVPVAAARLGAEAPPAYTWLAAQPSPGSVLEIPGTASGDDVVGNTRNGRYMVASTIHWKPLVNGWTAYPPHVAPLLAAAIRDLPDRRALDFLIEASELRWVVVHRDQLVGDDAARWPRGALPGLQLVQSFGDVDVYQVQRVADHSLRDEIISRSRHPASTTLDGTPTAPLDESCRRARIVAVGAPPRMLPIPAPRRVPVRFENQSACTWPALGVRADGLVTLSYRWVSPSGKLQPAGPVSRLLHDVAPGATIDATMMVTPPVGEFGVWRLQTILAQQGLAAPLATAEREVELRKPREPDRLPSDPEAASSF